VFRALAERNRLRIALILEMGPLNVSEIVYVLGLSQSNVSHHLKLLLDAGVVGRSGRANWAFYSRSRGEPMIQELVKTAFRYRNELKGFQEDMKQLAYCHNLRLKKSREFFDSVEEKHWRSLRDQLPHADEYLGFIQRSLGSAELVLEVGTGGGAMLPFLLESASEVMAVDNSREMLNRALKSVTAEKLVNRVDFRLGDAEHLPAGDAMVDAVFMHMLLHHSGNPQQAMKEAARVLKPAGILVLIDLAEHTDADFKEVQGDLWPGFKMYQLKEFVKESGFTVVEENSYNNNTVLALAGRKGAE